MYHVAGHCQRHTGRRSSGDKQLPLSHLLPAKLGCLPFFLVSSPCKALYSGIGEPSDGSRCKMRGQSLAG